MNDAMSNISKTLTQLLLSFIAQKYKMRERKQGALFFVYVLYDSS